MLLFEILEAFEFLGYVYGFWLFIFKSKYRKQQITKFYMAKFGKKLFMVVEALVSIMCGLLPVFIIWYVLSPN